MADGKTTTRVDEMNAHLHVLQLVFLQLVFLQLVFFLYQHYLNGRWGAHLHVLQLQLQ
jgi:hypothetical protein